MIRPEYYFQNTTRKRADFLFSLWRGTMM